MSRAFQFLRENEIFLILASTGTLVSTGMGIISPVLPLFGKSFGVSVTLVGLLVTSFGLARVLADLPSGYLTDRMDQRFLLVGGPVIAGVSSFLCGIASNFWELVAYRFLQGAGTAIFTTAAMVMVVGLTRTENRARVMGLYHGSLLIGAGLGPAIGGFTAEKFGYRAPFFLYAALSFASAISVLIRISRAKSWQEKTTARENLSWSIYASRAELKALFSNHNFILIAIVSFIIFFSRTGSKMTLVPLAGADWLGLGPGQIGLALTIVNVLNLLALYPAGSLADGVGRKSTIVPSLLLQAFAIIMFALSRNYGLFLLSAVLLGIGSGLAGPVPAAYAADVAPPGNFGLTMGLFRTFSDLGWMLGPVAMGFLADQTNYGYALAADGLLVLAGATLFALRAEETVGKKATQPLPVELDPG